MPDEADKKSQELEQALWIASEEGKWPVLCDQSPCLHRMRKMIKKMLEDDFKFKDRQSWTGFSGMAAVTALKHGGIPIPSKIALQYVGKKCRAYDDYWYIRPLKNSNGEIENHLKLLIGNPPGYETQEVPQELIDRLIKQALEFGE